MILDANTNPAGQPPSSADPREDPPGKPPPTRSSIPDILSLLDKREAVGLQELAVILKQRSADVHRSMQRFLNDGTIQCLAPVGLGNPADLLDHPDALPLVYYRAVRDSPSCACRKEQKMSWTRLSKCPHLAVD